MKQRNGICVAGNMIVDITYPIDVMPKSGDLVSITGEPIYTFKSEMVSPIVPPFTMMEFLVAVALSVWRMIPEVAVVQITVSP